VGAAATSAPRAPATAAPRQPDPVAEIAARQAALEAEEAKNLAGSLAVAGHIVGTGDKVLKSIFDAVMSPAAQERLKASIVEKPEKFVSLLVELAQAVERSTKSAERVFSMTRLAAGRATSIQEHRVAREPERSPEEMAAVSVAILSAVGRMDEEERRGGVIDVEANG
jgi:hypothetical protein